MPLGGHKGREATPALRHLYLAAILVAGCIGLAPAAMASPRGGANSPGDGYSVDHDGVYLTQQIGRCLNGTGRCYYGGQCPGGEARAGAYVDGRVYCRNFYPPRPYRPTLLQRLFGGDR